MKEISLFPRHSAVDTDGVLSIGGMRVVDVVNEYGTPVFIYDEQHLRETCKEAVAAFGADNVIYASKAFLCVAMAKLAYEEGLLLDVATGGELFVALTAGVPASSCVLHGNNKSDEELRTALQIGVRHIVVDSFDEIERIEKLVSTGLPAPRVQLRITPGVHVHTHEYVSTGQDDSKLALT
jgi:diaminopimelate decarboxylase